MRKFLLFVCIVMLCVPFSACGNGEKDTIKMTIGDSKEFTKAEIQSAMDCAAKKLKEFGGCTLTDIWYDESKSDNAANDYLSTGKGSTNGATAGNVIVLYSNFNVDASGGDGSLNRNSTYEKWCWILIRDSKNGAWRADDWGY
jgi:hypothetical protein